MRPRPFIRLSVGVIALLLGITACPAWAQELILEIFELRYRTVEQVLPVVQPLVPKPGTVSGMRSSLIVRTTRANLADVRRVLDSIDRLPRRLLITVRQDADTNREAHGASVSGRVGSSGARVVVPDRRDEGGAVVEGRRGDDRVRARVFGTRALENDRSTQQIQVLEGNEAFIRVGQSVPVPQRSVVRSVVNGRVVEQVVDNVEYRDVVSGFHVRPHVSADQVTLEVAPQRDTPGSAGPGSVNLQRLTTTVAGRLGEWIELGAIVTGLSAQSTGTVFRTQTVAGDDRRVLIKVDELP